MKVTSILFAILAVASFSFAADEAKKKDGAKAKQDPAAAFAKMDKNSDGKLSKEEFLGKKEGEAKTKGETQFGARDKDKDGSLSKEEFTAPGGKKKKAA